MHAAHVYVPVVLQSGGVVSQLDSSRRSASERPTTDDVMTTTPGHVTSSLSPWQPPVAWIPQPPPEADYSVISIQLLSSLTLRFDFQAIFFHLVAGSLLADL
jgi:hypothetical protein